MPTGEPYGKSSNNNRIAPEKIFLFTNASNETKYIKNKDVIIYMNKATTIGKK